MFVSAVLMAVFMSVLSLNLVLADGVSMTAASSSSSSNGVWPAVLRFLPALEVVGYMLAFGSGVGTVPWLMLGELCPASVKGATAGITVFVAYLTIFAVVKIFPLMVDGMGTAATYGVFAVVCAANAVFTALCVPQTRGKSLAQIEALFDPGEKRKKDFEARGRAPVARFDDL